MARGVDNEEAGQFERILLEFGDHFALLLYDGNRHVRRTNLLSDPARLPVLKKKAKNI